MEEKLTLSLVQMPIVVGDMVTNVARAYEHVVEAARRGSNLVVLPELWATGYDLESASHYVSPRTSGLFMDVARWAQELGIWIVGSLLERDGNAMYNTAHVASPEGKIVATYRKVHLFPLMDEHVYLQPGDGPVDVETPWGRVGLGICYDLRFPEFFLTYAYRDVSLILLPAEWPRPRLHHWRTLIQARAIENQVFFAACNRVGTSADTTFCGHSMVVSPWGDILLEAGEQEVLLTTQIDMRAVKEARKRIPVMTSRVQGGNQA